MKRALAITGWTAGSLAAAALAAALVLALIGGWPQPQRYLDPWARSYADTQSDPRLQLAAVGLLAASAHNLQPWRIRLDAADDHAFELYADPDRLAPEVDPDARQTMVSEGTFLEYVVAAGRERGWAVSVELFPGGGYDEARLAASMRERPVARLRLGASAASSGAAAADGVYEPDTNRSPYLAQPLTDAEEEALVASARTASGDVEPGVCVQVVRDASAVADLGDLALRAATIEAHTPRVMAESDAVFRANERRKNSARSGYSVEGQGTTGPKMYLLQGLLTMFPGLNEGDAAARTFISSTQASTEATPAYAVVTTAANTREQQVRSGMAYSRLILAAHARGLALQPLSQAIEEYPEMAGPYREAQQRYGAGGTVQMIVRVGHPTQDAAQTMRRDVADLVE